MDSMVEVGCQWDNDGQPISAGVEIKTISKPSSEPSNYGGVDTEETSLIGGK